MLGREGSDVSDRAQGRAITKSAPAVAFKPAAAAGAGCERAAPAGSGWRSKVLPDIIMIGLEFIFLCEHHQRLC